MESSDSKYLRVASCVPPVALADVKANIEAIANEANRASGQGAALAVFPEMCLTGYTCGDLFHNSTLLKAAEKGIAELLRLTEDLPITIAVGVPVQHNGVLYNCAAVISAAKLLALIPKTFLPNYNEFYEKRWFTPGHKIEADIHFAGQQTHLGTRQLVDINGTKVGFEICEDLWAPLSPSTFAALHGAEVICNLSASNAVIGKREYLIDLVRQQSARTISAYVYSSAGMGESSTDLVFEGIALVAQRGKIIASTPAFPTSGTMIVSDIDLQALRHDRIHNTTFGDCAALNTGNNDYRIVETPVTHISLDDIEVEMNPQPFVPSGQKDLQDRCRRIMDIQTTGLCTRLKAIGCKTAVIGISGGLDSTLALLVTVQAFKRLSLPLEGIIGITMPGFGTTGRTRSNATQLMELLGVSTRTISINAAVTQHFADIGHNPEVHDVTYENSQARMRTQILMDVANQTSGIVIGTGDLSELALGWATYNGDHMSMYAVNASVPKTLVRFLVSTCADAYRTDGRDDVANVLDDIIDTPVSPELIPADKNDNITQKTEDLVGPYELHDFFLYHTLRFGRTPEHIYYIALKNFEGKYSPDEISHWLKIFNRRFFQQQFKRSCMPDGPKVGSVCLSPRGDWRMPSDARNGLWQSQKFSQTKS